MARSSFWLLLAAVSAAACSAPPPGDARTPTTDSAANDAALDFPVGAAADYQLGGPYPPPVGTGVVVRDSSAAPAPGVYNICYVNAFQTQPEERDMWLREHDDLVLTGDDGGPVIDENWPDELLVDTSTEDNRRRLAEIVGRTIRSCAATGFDAVEIDNLDSYSRSNEKLTAHDNLALAAELGRIAHESGLLIGQKNSAELSERAKQEAGFEFAVAEECSRYAECAEYAAVYGDRVIDIEYTDNLAAPLAQVCTRPERPRSMMVRDRQLVEVGAEEYFYLRC
ncbi:secreted protein [Saccharopolyspora erythraea NRRL 2338]|uniref:Secreted protein n=2 Tax=Saccharopolyspora erythraea TaxID=1836 RepID=A4FKZ6_SACEN|nr:endo alpha-1,4 polygalactosaminidase [Saccharopolyspora erythraea]CAM04721.1 secreted protein [Saccharopolyspora erythraea NRRL 2338]